jgi:thiamine pyrophosphate-dependent acetolactate synthase large subunit-like protein
MTLMTGGQVVVESLVANGVEVVFGIPGTHSLPIYRHLQPSGIVHVNPRHEQGAGYAADGYARSSGRPGVCLVTTGPGVTNIATALGQAYSDSIPLLVISPGLPFALEGGDHGYLHETKNQSGVTAAIAAWSHRATSQQDLADALRRAFTFFGRGRPRPVHVEAPIEVLEQSGHVEEIRPGEPGSIHPPLPEAIEAAAELLSGGSRRVLVCGGGARGAQAEATRLAELLDMPVVTTTNGSGVVSERHPLSLGASISARAVQRYVNGCDVVLAVGTELGDSDLWGGRLVPAGKVIRIDVDGSQLDKNLAADLKVEADAKLALAAIADRLSGTAFGTAAALRRPQSVAEAAEVSAEVGRELAEFLDPWRTLHESLEKVLAPDAIVAGDAAMVCYFGTQFLFPFEGPSRWLYPTGFCTLGYGLPAAIGAKLANPDRQVVAVMGDGGVMFTLSEFATAVQLHMPLPLVVAVNGGYGEIRRELLAMGVDPVGTDFPAPDFVAVARGLGGEGVRVTSEGAGIAVAEAFERDRPTLIEVDAAE